MSTDTWLARVADTLARIPGSTSHQGAFLADALAQPGRYLLVHRDAGRVPADHAHALLVCGTGLFALRFADNVPAELDDIRRDVEARFGKLQFGREKVVAHDVQIVLLVPAGVGLREDGRFAVAGPGELDRVIRARSRRLRPSRVQAIANTIAHQSAREYDLLEIEEDGPPDLALLERSEVLAPQRDTALRMPFQHWMTFLDPEQELLVNRTYTGPARVTGPAGTGKTVVALHRMARQAKRSTGRQLYTTFVKTLANCQETYFRRLAPGTEGRVQFAGLHSWALDFLGHRIAAPRLDPHGADQVFGRVWERARADFEDIEPHGSYWREEIDRVIKGREIDDLDVYQRTERFGRDGVRLDADRRAEVWRKLYVPYVTEMRRRGISDYSDVIAVALAEIRNEPLAQPYDAVVVDEVQDMTLAGLRLAHAIAGGNGSSPLLLLGDGQQQVYAGGWRMADAGINLRGRGEILRVNYRNRRRVWENAAGIEAVNALGDFDDAPGVLLRDADVALPDGLVHIWRGPDQYLEAALVHGIRGCGKPLSDIAVLTRTRRSADRLAGALDAVGIATLRLEEYDGTPVAAVKVGTVHRAKGLDFAAVFHPTWSRGGRPGAGASRERAELADRQKLVAITRARDYAWVGIRDDRPGSDRA
ncbi:DEAD/DEAH box helicase [Nocardia abscessus]|uniref:UvrD-helicase domain-containing protein n=1 Tax=Nocardia TaxID=1817 RepID=UPI0018934A02|nr:MULTISPECIES: UvrD-helicase domain-containing protein [Nocardia]MBF6222317.1 DEAD/DEAH box helicase [Nocardia abscessus]MDE1671071.1 UvrD-helicase domain-containing protein [Nocardia gipuzkoensis]